MGMSTHVVGFKPKDEKWDKMLAIWELCVEDDIDPPHAVMEFFEYQNPTGKPGIEVDIKDCVKRYQGEMADGYDVHIDKLPFDAKVVRFYNSY